MALLRGALQLATHAAVVVASSSQGYLLVDAAARSGPDVEVESKPQGIDENFCQGSDEACTLPARKTHLEECGIWLAPSSLPGAGLGMYAGKDFQKDDPLQDTGDVVIPIVDIMMHQRGRKKFVFLWDEYTWNGKSLGLAHEVLSDSNAASPGFGSAANSFLDLVNVEEWDPKNEMPNGLHRSKDPGVGAFSTYHDRRSTAKVDIKKGEELFVNYGQHWFEQRIRLGPIPLRRGLKKSTNFYRKFKRMCQDNPKIKNEIFDEVWDVFVKQTEWKESRIFGAFHHTESERRMLDANKTLKEIRVAESMRNQEWFEEHGICADHIRGGTSTMLQAGWGAFATRDLPKGAVVSHLPLIQIVDKSVLEMYVLEDIKTKTRSKRTRVGYQIMTNYCYGHLNSTMLLCPYGPIVSLVNHNQTRANVKLQWSDPKRSNHVPDLLDKTIAQFAKDRTAKLAMDIVATRPIEAGEEILLDYGDEWEKAWQVHVKNWNPEGADEYISAFMLNKEAESVKFRTEFEQMKDPYPGNVNIECDSDFWKRANQTLFETTHIINITDPDDHQFWICDILRHKEVNGTTLYTVVVERPQDDKKKKKKEEEQLDKYILMKDIPAAAIRFTDRPYTSDMFLSGAFRHPIMIPDEIFPVKWMNFSPK